jgi:hypothetical protein
VATQNNRSCWINVTLPIKAKVPLDVTGTPHCSHLRLLLKAPKKSTRMGVTLRILGLDWIVGRWVTAYSCIFGTNALHTLTVQIEGLCGGAADVRQGNDAQAVARPDEVFTPVVLSWVEKRNLLGGFGIDSALEVALASVAVEAGKGKILEGGRATSAYGDNVVDGERNILPRLVSMEILAEVVRTLADLGLEGFGNPGTSHSTSDALKVTDDAVEVAKVIIDFLVLRKFLGLVRRQAAPFFLLQKVVDALHDSGGSTEGRNAFLEDDADSPIAGEAGRKLGELGKAVGWGLIHSDVPSPKQVRSL